MKQTNSILAWFTRLPKPFLYGIGVLLVLTVGIVDMLTGSMSDVRILYLLPVMLFAWFSGGVSVAVMSFVCTAAWFAADLAPGYTHFQAVCPPRQPLSVLCVFLLTGYALWFMKKFLVTQHDHRDSP